ncbi:MAG: DUF2341 domain-containing protein, partial [Candidatus Kariarchaeaceae archaeon]
MTTLIKNKPLIGVLFLAVIFLSASFQLTDIFDLDVGGKYPSDGEKLQKNKKDFVSNYDQTSSNRKVNPLNLDKLNLNGLQEKNTFPLLINIHTTDLKHALNSGYDIVFTDDSNNKLDHEIEVFDKSFNTTHAHLVAWVETNLSNIFDTIIIMYFGNPFANNQENSSGVWSNGYEVVWHLNEKPSEIIVDSTGFFDGTALGQIGDNQLESGKIEKALNFDGNDDRVVTGNIDSDAWTQLTLEAWINQNSINIAKILTKEAPNGGSIAWSLETRKTGGIDRVRAFITPEGGSTTEIASPDIIDNIGQWYYATFTWDGTTASVYVDGVPVASVPVSGPSIVNSSYDVSIGALSAGTADAFHGLIDEVRVSKLLRSPGWILTQFKNQNSPNSFIALESLEIYQSEQNWAIDVLKYRKNITISSLKFNEEMENFPYLFEIYDQDLHDKAQTDGEDILFTDTNGFRLEHEIEIFSRNFNSTHAYLIAWIKIPLISNVSDSIITMYYGNTDVKRFDPSNIVWENYLGVWHLSESVSDEEITPEFHQDSAFSSNDGDQSGNDNIDGIISQSQTLDGINDSIIVTNPRDLDIFEPESYTLSAWVYRNSSGTNDVILAKRAGLTNTDPGYILYFGADNRLYFEIASDNTTQKETWVYSSQTYTSPGWYSINIQFAL